MAPQITTLAPTKTTYTTPSPWESRLGYHRAIRKGPFIFVSGTTALRPTTTSAPPPPSTNTPPDTTPSSERYELKGPGDAYLQTRAAFAESLAAVSALGGQKADVVRVRMYVARQEDTEAVGRAFSEGFDVARHHKSKGEDGDGSDGRRDEGDTGDGVACAATMIVLGREGGGGFVDPEMLVEVEVDAVVL